jgi:hypothetical protein
MRDSVQWDREEGGSGSVGDVQDPSTPVLFGKLPFQFRQVGQNGFLRVAKTTDLQAFVIEDHLGSVKQMEEEAH